MGGIVRYVVEIGLGLVFAAIFIPLGLNYIADANMTGVTAIVAQIFTVVLPIMAVIGVGLKFMPDELKSKFM